MSACCVKHLRSDWHENSCRLITKSYLETQSSCRFLPGRLARSAPSSRNCREMRSPTRRGLPPSDLIATCLRPDGLQPGNRSYAIQDGVTLWSREVLSRYSAMPPDTSIL